MGEDSTRGEHLGFCTIWCRTCKTWGKTVHGASTWGSAPSGAEPAKHVRKCTGAKTPNSRHAALAVGPSCRAVDLVSKHAKDVARIHLGSWVEAQWDNGKWHKAKLELQNRDGSYKVYFELFGVARKRAPEKIRRAPESEQPPARASLAPVPAALPGTFCNSPVLHQGIPAQDIPVIDWQSVPYYNMQN